MKRLALPLAATALAVACSSAPAAPDQACTPKSEAYCRCENLDEGSQICRDDGSGYEPCEPCSDEVPPDFPPYRRPDASATNDASTSADADRDASQSPDSSTCGNGAVDDGESCDDGNDIADDGCDGCVAGGNPLDGSVCPGVVVHLWEAPYVLDGSTADASFAHTGIDCDGETGENSPDRVYALVPHHAGSIRVELLASNFDAALFGGTRCDEVDEETQTACSLDGTMQLPNVEPDKPVYLTVDGAGASQKGTYTLRLTFVAE